MAKPKDYELGKNEPENVALFAIDDGERYIFLSGNYNRRLFPRNARAMAKRLNAMADWVEAGK